MGERSVESAVLDPKRLSSVHAARLLDTPPDPDFDRWTRFVRTVLAADVALITVLDRDRQFFKSAAGLGEPWSTRRETPLSHSFCKHVVARDDALVVRDAREDPELADNRAIPELGVVAYAGVPLRTREGHLLGSLSAIQRSPREWTDRDVEILQDIAAAVRSEIELKTTEDRTRAITANASDLISILDQEGRTLYHSESLGRILGREPADHVGETFLDLVHAADRGRLLEARDELLARRQSTVSVTFRARHAGGSDRILEAQLTDLLENPAVRGILAVARDVTERRELEARLLQSQKMDAIGRLAGGVAHDFNNLLSVIDGTAGLVLQDMPTSDPARGDLEEIRHAAARASELTRQLLAFSRQQVLHPRPVDLNEIVGRSARMLRRIIRGNVELVVTRAEGACTVMADPVQMEQVILNLAINARDAMPDGGRLTIATRIEATEAAPADPEEAGRSAVLEVSDTGEGMDEETRARAFEPFFTTKGADKGTGLGLATVYGIVKQSGGSVELESEPGEGTRVIASLPCHVEK